MTLRPHREEDLDGILERCIDLGVPHARRRPALSIKHGLAHDGWISTLWRHDPGRPTQTWDEVRAELAS